MLVDTHTHIDFDNFDDDREQVIARAGEAGVHYLLNVGTDLDTSKRSIALAEHYPHVYASAGIHPHDASGINQEEAVAEIVALLDHPKVVALGEVGLDYYRNHATSDDQQALLKRFVAVQKKTGLPLILHARDAYDDIFAILEEAYGAGPIPGVMHCFAGDEAVLKRAVALGLYVSLTAPVTYKKNDALRALVPLIPDDQLLLETDAPFLSPQSKRGKRNEPAYLPESAALIAELRGISLEDLARITTLNCNRLFGFPEVDTTPRAVYKIRNAIYINTTTGCTNDCTFCVRFFDDFVKGYNLRIAHDPTVAQTLAALDAYSYDAREIVFCGMGEPTMRLDFIKEVARVIKEKQKAVRIDTNGHANIINKRNVLPELAGLVDAVCVSLNAPTEELYNTICQPHFAGHVFRDVTDFILEAKKVIPKVVISYVDVPEVDSVAMEALAAELGVECRCRHYNRVG